MPAIVIGADTVAGLSVASHLVELGGEVRAVVSDPQSAKPLRNLGIIVAIGDLSDDSLIELASGGCFTAIFMADAADDGRELAFAATPQLATSRWIPAVIAASVSRIIWVGTPPVAGIPDDCFLIENPTPGIAVEVARLDALPENP